jgi:hypothetical protein
MCMYMGGLEFDTCMYIGRYCNRACTLSGKKKIRRKPQQYAWKKDANGWANVLDP